MSMHKADYLAKGNELWTKTLAWAKANPLVAGIAIGIMIGVIVVKAYF